MSCWSRCSLELEFNSRNEDDCLEKKVYKSVGFWLCVAMLYVFYCPPFVVLFGNSRVLYNSEYLVVPG